MTAKMKELKARWAVELGLGKNPVAQFGAPVSFTAHLDAITPGQTQVLAVSGLANGFRSSYVIDEIRMQAYMRTPSATLLQPSYALAFQFRTGSYAFSRVPVPMVLHAPAYTGIGNTGNPALRSLFAGGLTRLGDEARWALSKPLWMAPGDQIQCIVKRDSTAAATSVDDTTFVVDVTYVGRSLKPGTPGPKTRFVPWVAHYVHDFSESFSQTMEEFRNQFTFPLTIQRLIGRPLSKAVNGTFNSARVAMLPDETADDQYAAIYIEDSLGYKVTRSAIAGKFSPVGAIFDTERCVWTFSRPIGPRDQLNMQFQTLGTNVLADQLFGVSLQGYREETA
jgi:hypothetical protein